MPRAHESSLDKKLAETAPGNAAETGANVAFDLHVGAWFDQARPGMPAALAPASVEDAIAGALTEAAEYARRGDETTADAFIAQAATRLGELGPDSVARAHAAARVAIAEARRAVRRGSLRDAEGHAQAALKSLRALATPPPTTTLAALELLATTAIMQGRYEVALRRLQGAEHQAVSVGDPWVPRIQRLLGAIHARRGKPLLAARAYTLATSRLRDDEAPLEVAKLSSNLAMVALMAGQVATARAAIERALRLREAHRAPLGELANSTAVLALVDEREERPESAATWERAVTLARQSKDPVLAAEIELRAASAAVERGSLDAARGLAESAIAEVARGGDAERTLAAMAAETRARIRHAEGAADDACAAAREALAAYRALDASYHVARLELLLARLEGSPHGPVTRIAEACRLALRDGFELAWRPGDQAAIARAAQSGHRDVRRYCKHAGIASASDCAVLVVDGDGALETPSGRHELGPRSIPFRLARILVAAAPAAVAVTTICRRIWPDEGHDERTANRLKVHVHRLRDLVGGDVSCVITETETRRGERRTTYRWNSAVPARVVRALVAGEAI